MRASSKLLLWVSIALGLLLLVPALIPTAKWIPAVQRIVEAKLQQPVSIKDLRFAILPRPSIELQGIRIGNPTMLDVEAIQVKPSILPLLKASLVVSSVTIEKPAFTLEALSFAQELITTSSSSESNTDFAIQQITVHDARLLHPSMNLPLADVEANLVNKSQLKSANLRIHDEAWQGELLANVSTTSNGYQAVITGHQFPLPNPVPLHIESLSAQATFENNKLNVTLNEVGLYHGIADGELGLTLGETYVLQGKMHLKQLSVGDVLKSLTNQSTLTGSLDSEIHFSAKAKEVGKLIEGIQASGPFAIKKGILHGVDLLKLASVLITKSDGNGNTEFETLQGKLRVKGKQYQLNELIIESGLIHADGHVSIHQSALDGLLKVEVKKSASLVGVPLAISGTLQEPSISITKSAMAGAALGTAVLGPGVGTSVGINVGDKLNQLKEGLFGKKK